MRKRLIISILIGKRRKALLESFKVLERKHRGRREHRDLLVIADRFERGAHGDFRLAVTHIATKQAVHRLVRLHVALYVGDRLFLIFRLVVLEGIFKLFLPLGIGLEAVALRHAPFGVELQQFVGHILHGLLDACLGLGPLAPCQGG